MNIVVIGSGPFRVENLCNHYDCAIFINAAIEYIPTVSADQYIWLTKSSRIAGQGKLSSKWNAQIRDTKRKVVSRILEDDDQLSKIDCILVEPPKWGQGVQPNALIRKKFKTLRQEDFFYIYRVTLDFTGPAAYAMEIARSILQRIYSVHIFSILYAYMRYHRLPVFSRPCYGVLGILEADKIISSNRAHGVITVAGITDQRKMSRWKARQSVVHFMTDGKMMKVPNIPFDNHIGINRLILKSQRFSGDLHWL